MRKNCFWGETEAKSEEESKAKSWENVKAKLNRAKGDMCFCFGRFDLRLILPLRSGQAEIKKSVLWKVFILLKIYNRKNFYLFIRPKKEVRNREVVDMQLLFGWRAVILLLSCGEADGGIFRRLVGAKVRRKARKKSGVKRWKRYGNSGKSRRSG